MGAISPPLDDAATDFARSVIADLSNALGATSTRSGRGAITEKKEV